MPCISLVNLAWWCKIRKYESWSAVANYVVSFLAPFFFAAIFTIGENCCKDKWGWEQDYQLRYGLEDLHMHRKPDASATA